MVPHKGGIIAKSRDCGFKSQQLQYERTKYMRPEFKSQQLQYECTKYKHREFKSRSSCNISVQYS